MMLSNRASYFLNLATKLRVDRKDGIAPHKPLLLLVVAELAERGELISRRLSLSPELTFNFVSFWSVVAARRPQKPDIRLPFFHLWADGFWLPLDENGAATQDRKRTATVELEDEFWQLLHDDFFREDLRRTLIAKYFTDSGERAALYELVGLPIPPDSIVQADAKRYETTLERGRNARFRLTVLPAYAYTCALFGFRLTTLEFETVVDAAHIHQFAKGGNNDPRNGLALSKSAHWMFDRGLWSISDDFRILLARDCFTEAGPVPYLLSSFEGREIFLPKNHDYWPHSQYLRWHRDHLFGKKKF